jgi:hypothetical protein
MMTWRNPANAAQFALRVTRLAAIHASDSRVLLVVDDMLRFLQTHADVMSVPFQTLSPALQEQVFALSHAAHTLTENKSPRDETPLFSLFREAWLLWPFTRGGKERSPRSVANTTERWVYTWAEDIGLTRQMLRQIELPYRLTDLDDGTLSQEQRDAFEAAWNAGHDKLARQITQRKARN